MALGFISTGTEAHYPCTYVLIDTGIGPNKFRVCLSKHGNVVEFQSPEGHNPTGGEGYAVCSTGPSGAASQVHGWDAGIPPDPYPLAPTPESGFGSAPKSFTNPPTIVRATEDGAIRLTQTFRVDAIEKSVTITMVIQNVSPGALQGVQVARYVVVSQTPDQTDVVDMTADSAWIRGQVGLATTAASFGVPHQVSLEAITEWYVKHTLEGCISSGLGADGPGGVAWVIYQLGELPADAPRTVRVVYRRL